MAGFGQAPWVKVSDFSTSPVMGIGSFAISPAGDMAVISKLVSGVTTGTGFYNSVEYRQANYYVTHSANFGSSWSAPRLISNPLQYNNESDLIATGPGEFWTTWTSGDPLSGFRLHTAHTSDGGQTYTTQTQEQQLNDAVQGNLFPRLTYTGTNLLISATGYHQNIMTRPDRGYIKTLQNGDLTVSATYIADLPATSQTEKTLITGRAVATTSGTIIAPITRSYYISPFGWLGNPGVLRSSDGGQSWSAIDHLTTMTASVYQAINTDGNGTWLQIVPEATRGSYSYRLSLRRSTDDGNTWQLIPDSFLNYYIYGNEEKFFLETDGQGRWLCLCQTGRYNYSENNGQTWSQNASLPGYGSLRISGLQYIGNGRWVIAQTQGHGTTANHGVYRMQWGPSSVHEWSLY